MTQGPESIRNLVLDWIRSEVTGPRRSGIDCSTSRSATGNVSGGRMSQGRFDSGAGLDPTPTVGLEAAGDSDSEYGDEGFSSVDDRAIKLAYQRQLERQRKRRQQQVAKGLNGSAKKGGFRQYTREDMDMVPWSCRINTNTILSREFIAATLVFLDSIWQKDVESIETQVDAFMATHRPLFSSFADLSVWQHPILSWCLRVERRLKFHEADSPAQMELARELGLGIPHPHDGYPCPADCPRRSPPVDIERSLEEGRKVYVGQITFLSMKKQRIKEIEEAEREGRPPPDGLLLKPIPHVPERPDGYETPPSPCSPPPASSGRLGVEVGGEGEFDVPNSPSPFDSPSSDSESRSTLPLPFEKSFGKRPFGSMGPPIIAKSQLRPLVSDNTETSMREIMPELSTEMVQGTDDAMELEPHAEASSSRPQSHGSKSGTVQYQHRCYTHAPPKAPSCYIKRLPPSHVPFKSIDTSIPTSKPLKKPKARPRCEAWQCDPTAY